MTQIGKICQSPVRSMGWLNCPDFPENKGPNKRAGNPKEGTNAEEKANAELSKLRPPKRIVERGDLLDWA